MNEYISPHMFSSECVAVLVASPTPTGQSVSFWWGAEGQRHPWLLAEGDAEAESSSTVRALGCGVNSLLEN